MMMNVFKRWPLYPWLFVLYPILFVYAQNVDEIFVEEVAIVLTFFLALATLLFRIFNRISKNIYFSAALLTVLIIPFFTYGHIATLTDNLFPDIALSALYFLLCVSGIVIIVRMRKTWNFEYSVASLNLIGAVLILMTLPALLGYYYRQMIQPPDSEAFEHPRLDDSTQRPDIYYIILDAYSSNRHLLRDFGYDNSDFTDALEERGFFVAYDSKTSYGLTVVSLASSLNMRYIDESDAEAGARTRSGVHYYRTLVADNAVALELQTRGYTYIDMLSGFAVPSTIADVNIDFYASGPEYYYGVEGQQQARSAKRGFVPLILNATIFPNFSDSQDVMQPLLINTSYNFLAPQRALMTWDEAEKIPEMSEATFTFIHIIKPHGPTSFDRNGNIIDPEHPPDTALHPFFEQLQFINARTLEMIDTILEKSSTPPIIIIQGDHGSRLGSVQSLDGKRTNFEILNGYYLPGQPDCITDPAIIPINSFRQVLNCYFGTDYPLLEEHHFAMPKNYADVFFFEAVDIDEWMREREPNPLYDPAARPDGADK
jgi:hypothetical protein